MSIKKRITLALVSIMLLVSIPVPVFAANVLKPACTTDPNTTLCEDNTPQDPNTGNSLYGPNGLLTRAASLFAIVVGVAAVIMIIIGGFKYVTSLGDPSNIKSAKDTILYAIAGIVVAITAQSIVLFVLNGL